MQHRADKLAYGADIKIRIGVKRDQIPNAREEIPVALEHMDARSLPAQKTAKLQHAAALSLPADISVFADGSAALANEESEEIPILRIERGDPALRVGDHRSVLIRRSFFTLTEISENGETDVLTLVRQVKIFDFIKNRGILLLAEKQRRNRDQRPRFVKFLPS